MSTRCTVLIAPADLLPALTARMGTEADGDLLTFPDTEARSAIEAILKRKPEVVALERLYAATSRGAAVINRIKIDPSLVKSEIRVLAHDSDYMRVSPRKPAAPPSQPLDQRGTRRAPRFRLANDIKARLDGGPAGVVDLSTCGAQIVSGALMRPGQTVRFDLTDDQGALEFTASVAWAHFEIAPTGGSRYRAGIEFVDPNVTGLEAFCTRHKA